MACNPHVSDHDFERYHLGLVTSDTELIRIEEHYLGCAACAKLAEESAQFIDLMRAAIAILDLERD